MIITQSARNAGFSWRSLSLISSVIDVTALQARSLCLTAWSELSVEVLFHDEFADGDSKGGSKTAVLNVYSHGDARLFHRSKAHEG